jgi:hypothetical protein
VQTVGPRLERKAGPAAAMIDVAMIPLMAARRLAEDLNRTE